MKTTLDLHEALLREIKLRAVLKGQKFKDAIAELLRRGLSVGTEVSAPLIRPTFKTHPKTGLPYIERQHEASADEEMTPERVSDLLVRQETAWHDEAR